MAGVAMLFGTLPFDSGIPAGPNRLEGTGVFVARGEQDTVIPTELQARTWSYLHEESGAEVESWLDPGAHEISRQTERRVSEWLSRRLQTRL